MDCESRRPLDVDKHTYHVHGWSSEYNFYLKSKLNLSSHDERWNFIQYFPLTSDHYILHAVHALPVGFPLQRRLAGWLAVHPSELRMNDQQVILFSFAFNCIWSGVDIRQGFVLYWVNSGFKLCIVVVLGLMGHSRCSSSSRAATGSSQQQQHTRP